MTVTGGVAHLAYAPDDMEVVIVDFDDDTLNLEDIEQWVDAVSPKNADTLIPHIAAEYERLFHEAWVSANNPSTGAGQEG